MIAFVSETYAKTQCCGRTVASKILESANKSLPVCNAGKDDRTFLFVRISNLNASAAAGHLNAFAVSKAIRRLAPATLAGP